MIEARIYIDGKHSYNIEADEIRAWNVIRDVTRPEQAWVEVEATGDKLFALVVKGSEPRRIETALTVVDTILADKDGGTWSGRT